jgi:hypothetical protein
MHVRALNCVAPRTLNCGTRFSYCGQTDSGNLGLTTPFQTAQRSWAEAGTAWNLSISAPNPMRPSPYGSLRTWTTRAVQRISCEEFPVTSAGIRSVASIGIPTWRGADDAKKNPPRETFNASVKCSVLSAATPRARKRRGVRRLRRASCRRSVTFIFLLPARGRIWRGSR